MIANSCKGYGRNFNRALCFCFSLLYLQKPLLVTGFSSSSSGGGGQGFGVRSKRRPKKNNPQPDQNKGTDAGTDGKTKGPIELEDLEQQQHQQHPLLDWLGSTFAESEFGSLEIRASVCGDGVGAFTTKAVEDGEVVLAVPSQAFISASSALQHPSLGVGFRQLWKDTGEDDPKGSSVLAALVAHLLLNNDSSTENAVYLDMLPKQTPDEKHALWWTDTEMELIRTTSGYEDWVELREDVVEMTTTIIGSGVLSSDVELYGDGAVQQAVRAGFVAVLSRAYGIFSSDGREFKTLIPLLDALNHAAVPNVQYSYEGQAGEAGLSGLLVGRAIGSLKKGEELTISYGSHPDHIFGLYFGFVPTQQESVTTHSEATKEATSPGADGSVRQCCKEMAHAMHLSKVHE